MASSDVNEEFNPGAARYGNFINYYQFNTTQERLSHIPGDLLQQLNFDCTERITMLDIGCNAGNLTHALYKHLCLPVDHFRLNILAVDLDPTLIRRAKETNPYPENIHYLCADFTVDKERASALKFLQLRDMRAFDMACCFSVTMWIHLNHGDEGLRAFLCNVSRVARYLLLEPQTWKCYRNASRRMRRAQCETFQNLHTLTMNRNIVDDIIEFLRKECHMALVKSFGESPWGRKIMLFQNMADFVTNQQV